MVERTLRFIGSAVLLSLGGCGGCGGDSPSGTVDAAGVDAPATPDAGPDAAGTGDCGDGVLDPPIEECDDGDNDDGDGCDGACQLEPVGQSCGDTLDPGEVCDDGNLNNGDGCNPTCNFLTQVTELAIGVPGSIITSDGTYLYTYGANGNCQIHRAAIATCTPGSCPFTAIAGVGCGGAQADGPGASAVLGTGAGGLAFGLGTLYFSDDHTVRAVDLSSGTFDVTTIAGDPGLCGQADGTGAAAIMSDVRGLAYYDDLLYFVDANMATLRQVDPATGAVTTLAGQTPDDNAGTGYDCTVDLCCGSTAAAMDGQGTAAIMNSARYLTSDNSGGLFLIDTNGSAIRHYDVGTGYLGTVVSGVGYVDGVGAAVRMDRPRGVTSDGTSLYFAEQDESTIRQIVIASADTSTFVGVRGCPGPANLNGGVGGDGTQSWAGNCGAAAVASKPQFPTGIVNMTFDYATGAIYAIATGNRLIRIE